MAERPAANHRPGAATAHRVTRTNTAGVRRNLFQSQLTRRPTHPQQQQQQHQPRHLSTSTSASAPASTSVSFGSGFGSGSSSGAGGGSGGGGGTVPVAPSTSSVETLLLGTAAGDHDYYHNNNNSSSHSHEDDTMQQQHHYYYRHHHHSGNGVDLLSETSEIVIRDQNGDFDVGDPPTPPPPDDPEEAALDDAQENERERQKLAEAVRHHQVNHTRTPAQPEEVMEALRASMRAKVSALTEDNWMYEAEEEVRVQ
ncbi:hypothetical protein GGR56DRAFT_129590 [Xylariaceae sp. FL0804]|nr:hypothetical protein GGR56DRAFT_129590 [Xylariaceae sp. FL0804]